MLFPPWDSVGERQLVKGRMMEDISTPVTAGSIPATTSHSVMEIRWLSLLQRRRRFVASTTDRSIS